MNKFQENNLKFLLKNIIFYGFLTIYSFLFFARFFKLSFPLNTYVFSEWLINYSQGFVRRGLLGTFLLYLNQNFNIDPYPIVRCFSYVSLFIFSAIYIYKIWRNKNFVTWEILATLLFLPSLVFFPLQDWAVVGRKEFFFFFALLINLMIIQRTAIIPKIKAVKNTNQDSQGSLLIANQKYCLQLFVWFNLISIPTALSHEAILWLSLPINIVITFNLLNLTFSKKESIVRSTFIYSPTILIAITCYFRSGNKAIARGICESWQPFMMDKFNCENKFPTAIFYLGKSIQDLLIEIHKLLSSELYLWIIVLGISSLVLLRTSSILIDKFIQLSIFKNSPNQDHIYSMEILTNFVIKYALIPFAFSIPLFLIAMDWGRWFFVVAVSYVICLLSSDLLCLEIIYSRQEKFLFKGHGRIYSIFKAIIDFFLVTIQRFYPLYCLILVYALLIMRIPHYNIHRTDLYGGLVKALLTYRL